MGLMAPGDHPRTKQDLLADPAVLELIDDITADDSTMTFAEHAADERVIRLSTPSVRVGDPAPDFELPLYDFSDGQRRVKGGTFRLQEVAGNTPVALVFGSYT
jgi:hypothetical protein